MWKSLKPFSRSRCLYRECELFRFNERETAIIVPPSQTRENYVFPPRYAWAPPFLVPAGRRWRSLGRLKVTNTFIVLLLLMIEVGCVQQGGMGEIKSGGRIAEGAIEALTERAQNTETVRGQGAFTGSLGRASGRYNFSFVLRQPDRLRVDVLDPAMGVLGVLIMYDDTLYWYMPAEQTVYAMTADAASLKRLTKIELMPRELVRLLAGLPPTQAAAWLSHDGTLLSPDRRAAIFFGSDGRHVEGYRAYQDQQQKKVTVNANFHDYRAVRGIDFPHRIALTTPGSGGKLDIVYNDIEVNPTVDASAFRIEVPDTTKIVQW